VMLVWRIGLVGYVWNTLSDRLQSSAGTLVRSTDYVYTFHNLWTLFLQRV